MSERELWVVERERTPGMWIPMVGCAMPDERAAKGCMQSLLLMAPGSTPNMYRARRYLPDDEPMTPRCETMIGDERCTKNAEHEGEHMAMSQARAMS